jgi:putative nucleotidyltransferase with HDIG domain
VKQNNFKYRISQLLHAVFSQPDKFQIERVSQILEPDQFDLFLKLQNSEQFHAIRVMSDVETAGFSQLEFLKAALLHDIGKTVHPLKIWERALIVLFSRFNPESFRDLSDLDLKGWKRGLVIAKKHPEWGADLISDTNISKEMVAIIRTHHSYEIEYKDKKYSEFFQLLRSIDGKN